MRHASVAVSKEHRVSVVRGEVEPEVEQFAGIAYDLANLLDGLRAIVKHLLKSRQFRFAKTSGNVHQSFFPVHQ
jgi:hypothetical protein